MYSLIKHFRSKPREQTDFFCGTCGAPLVHDTYYPVLPKGDKQDVWKLLVCSVAGSRARISEGHYWERISSYELPPKFDRRTGEPND